MIKKFFIIIISGLLISGCVKFKGEFAFKNSTEDKYRKMGNSIEFGKKEKINWVYIFQEVKGTHNIGVVLLKKELVWADIKNSVESVSETNKIIYGSIEGLPAGTYKIILTESGNVIDEKEFDIFSDNDDYYEYEDKE